MNEETKNTFLSTVARILDEYVEAYGSIGPFDDIVDYVDFPWAFDEHETYALVNYLLESGYLATVKDELEARAGHGWDGLDKATNN